MLSNYELAAQLRHTAEMIAIPLTVEERNGDVEIIHHGEVIVACLVRVDGSVAGLVEDDTALLAIRLIFGGQSVVLFVEDETLSGLQSTILRALPAISNLRRMLNAKLVPCRWCARPIDVASDEGMVQHRLDCSVCRAHAAAEFYTAQAALDQSVTPTS